MNRFFTDLLGHDFDEIDIGNGDNTMYTVSAVYMLQSNILFNSYHNNIQCEDDGHDHDPILMYRTDLYFKTDPELAAIAMDFAQDESLLLATVAEAWQLLMNADMFSGSQVGRQEIFVFRYIISTIKIIYPGHQLQQPGVDISVLTHN